MTPKVDKAIKTALQEEGKYIKDSANRPPKQAFKQSVYLFLSFDISNSTRYKCNNVAWARDYNNVFDIIICSVKSEVGSMIFWKFRGDEIIFTQEALDINDILTITARANDALELCEEEIEKQYGQNTLLGVKGAVWVAPVKKLLIDEHDNDNIRNIFFANDDFIGLDIDIGFRAAQYTEKGRVAVDTKIAYLMYMNKNNKGIIVDFKSQVNNLVITTYKKFKGVTNKRAYPIIWYVNDKEKFRESFDYDDYLHSEIVSDLHKRNYTFDKINAIEEIVDKLELHNEIDEIIEVLANREPIFRQVPEHSVELHLSVVCIDPRNENIFIVKRSSRRLSSPNIWEFGCTRDDSNTHVKDLVLKRYKKNFKLDIDIITDDKGLPIPVSLFDVSKNMGDMKYTGILFVATIIEDIQTLDDTIDISRYSDRRMVSIDELKKMFDEKNSEEKPFSDNIIDLAEKALELYRKQVE